MADRGRSTEGISAVVGRGGILEVGAVEGGGSRE